MVGDGGLKNRLDDADEVVKKGGNPKIKELAANEPIDEVGDTTGEGSSSGTGMAALAIVGGGVVFYMMSQ